MRPIVLLIVIIAATIVGCLVAWVVVANRRMERRRARWLTGSDRLL